MSKKRMLGIIFVILGIIIVLSSFYIKRGITEGKKLLTEAQGKIKQENKIFPVNPITKDVSKELIEGAQKKIEEATKKVNFYSNLVLWIQILGGILIILGIVLIIIGRKKKLLS